MSAEPASSTPDLSAQSAAHPLGSRRWDALYLLILLAVGAAIFFGTMGCRDLWEPEELRYAQITTEMMQTHQWSVLHLNTVTYPDKPPLFFWTIALCTRALGHADKPTEFSMRLPCVLAGLGVLLFTFLLGRRLYGGRGAFLSGLFLLTMPFFAQMAIEARMDMMLTLFITAALFCFYVAYVDKHGTWLYLVAYVFLGLAVLTKGPVGALLPILAFAVFALLKDNLHGAIYWHLRGRALIAGAAERLRIRLSPVPMRIGWGLLVMAAIVGPWLAVACLRGGATHTYELLFHQNFNRYFDSWTHNNESFFLYFLFVPLQVLPWALFLPSMIAFSAVRKPHETQRSAATAAHGCWARRFPLIWFATVLLFFTFCSSKRWIYTLPLVPAAALMLGGLVDAFLAAQAERTKARVLMAAACVGTLGLMILAPVALLVTAAVKFRVYLPVAAPASAILFLGAAAALWLRLKGRLRPAMVVTFVTVLLAWTATCWTLFPYRNREISAKNMVAKIRPFVHPGETLYTYATERNGYEYYWNRQPPLENLTKNTLIELNAAKREKRLAEARERLLAMFQGPQPAICLMPRNAYEKLKTEAGFKAQELLTDLMGSRDLVLVSNQPRQPAKDE